MNTLGKTNEPSFETLIDMITFRRPAGSKTERYFIKKFITSIPGMEMDSRGNCILQIGSDPVLWSCHTDTVHNSGGIQEVAVDKGFMLGLSKREKLSNCLGADDTAGVWLLTQMIEAGVPGTYVFHRAEECGGIGSSHIAKHNPEFLEGMKAAIAFDRRGTTSVITHQGWDRCCSSDFANSLIGILPTFKQDDGGTFTDTANYTDHIGECTNLSAGYYSEHSKNETLDVLHLYDLRDTLLLNYAFDKLKFSRKAGEVDADRWTGREYYGGSYGSSGRTWLDEYYGQKDANQEPSSVTTESGTWKKANGVWTNHGKKPSACYSPSLLELVKKYPAEIADFLEQMGYDEENILTELPYIPEAAYERE